MFGFIMVSRAIMHLGVLSTSFSHCWWVNFFDFWCKKSSNSAVWWLVTIHLLLDHVPEVFKRGSSLGLGWPWWGLGLVVLHRHLDWPDQWLAGKKRPQTWGTLSEQKGSIDVTIWGFFSKTRSRKIQGMYKVTLASAWNLRLKLRVIHQMLTFKLFLH